MSRGCPHDLRPNNLFAARGLRDPAPVQRHCRCGGARRQGPGCQSTPPAQRRRHLHDVPCRQGGQGRRRQVDSRRRGEVREVGARGVAVEVHRLSRRRLGRQAAARRKAETRRLRELPREGRQGVRRDGARCRAQGRQRDRRQLHGLPRHARHPAVEGSGFAHQSRQHRGDVLDLPRQRRHGCDGQTARREHRRQVPRQHPRQGAAGRCAGLRAHLHQLPRRPRHSPQGRCGESHSSRQNPGHLRHVSQAGARGLRRRHARQTAPGRHPGRAGLHRLPLRAQHRAARHAEIPDRGDQGVRHLSRRLPCDVSRHVPRPGHGARLLAGGDVRLLPRRARGAAGVESRIEGVGAEPGYDLPGLPSGCERELRQLRSAREQARQGAQSALLVRGQVHGDPALRRVRVLRRPHHVVVLQGSTGQAAARQEARATARRGTDGDGDG